MPTKIKPAYNAAAYTAKRMELRELARDAFAIAMCGTRSPGQPEIVSELAHLIRAAAIDGYNLANARDLARWAGAARVGRTRDDAIEALAIAWLAYQRDVRTPGRVGEQARSRMRAHELGLTITEFYAHVRAEADRIHGIDRLRYDRGLQRAAISRKAAAHGRIFEVIRGATPSLP